MNDNYYETTIDAHNPTRILSAVDWVSDAPVPKPEPRGEGTYNIWGWGINDPTCGKRSVETAPYDTLASPIGWHAIPANRDPSSPSSSSDIVNSTTTWGNNVFAQENWEGANNWKNNYRPDAGNALGFDYKYGPNSGKPGKYPPKDYIDLAVTHLFYTCNMIHDLYYRYGFDEASGNFQQFNFGKGGKDGDAVIANAQDGSGYNNANFMTPPDGQNGKMRMYVWNTAEPYRDGDLEAGIVIHEYSHGLSTRLTGGPANSGCLGWGESGGMGEGWGDFLATTIRSTKKYSDYPMGSWAANEEKGIRHFPYSTDEEVNPSVYKTLDGGGYWGVHAIGEVWAQILWIVEQDFIEKYGFSATLFPPQPLEDGTIPEGDFYRPAQHTADGKRKALIPKHGNTLIVQLVINGMKLQPCRPSFFQARDAIIQADEVLTGGENACLLWKGFAKRGLGSDATLKGSTPWGGGIRTNGFNVPRGVCKD
jgi:extracellular elastinolytic metalloproteinase